MSVHGIGSDGGGQAFVVGGVTTGESGRDVVAHAGGLAADLFTDLADLLTKILGAWLRWRRLDLR